MAVFHVLEASGRYGDKAELIVCNSLQRALRDRPSATVHAQYPVCHDHIRVPDFLLLDRDLGLVVVEVKGLVAGQIKEAVGDCWRVDNYFGREHLNPFQQARDALDLVVKHGPDHSPPRRTVVALPYIRRKDWPAADGPAYSQLLFRDDLDGDLFDKLVRTPAVNGHAWTEERFNAWQAYFGTRDHEEASTGSTKGEFLRRSLVPFEQQKDQQLRGDSFETPSGVFRIRGIAGSGKTTILTQTAAWMLFNKPERRLGFVFHTHSLFDHCFSLIEEALRRLSADSGKTLVVDRADGRLSFEGYPGAIRVFNSWGSNKREGFYGRMCRLVDAQRIDVATAKRRYQERFGSRSDGGDLLPLACLELLEKHGDRIPAHFDALFIDEAQDLISSHDGLAFEGDKEPFFWLAYKSLRECGSDNPLQRRLIFAYDEAQSLSTLHIPSARALFGEELSQLFTGGRARNRIMKCCFRNPRSVLMSAHALGMGFLRKGGAVQGLNKQEWEAIGYRLRGDLRRNDLCTLSRTDENSPNPITSGWRGDVITISEHDSEDDELEAVRRSVLQDITSEGLKPSRDILIVDLHGRAERIKSAFEHSSLNGSAVPCFVPNRSQRDCTEFWREGHVTATTIRKAKGNEAPMVYIVGLDALTETYKTRPEEIIRQRNTLFVALTRSRGWVHLSGIKGSLDTQRLFEEVRSVIGMVQSSGSAFQFLYKKTAHGFRDLGHEDQDELLLL